MIRLQSVWLRTGIICAAATIVFSAALSCGKGGEGGRGLVKENDRITTVDLGRVNAYLLKASDGFILVDTGMPGQWNMLEKSLKKAGCLPDRLKLVVLTHGDIDHSGNCAKLKDTYGAKIAIHRGDAGMVEKGVRPVREVKTFRGWIIYLLGKLTRGRNALPLFTPDVFLADGQNLKEYGADAVIHHVPGHTAGSIVILTPEGDLFVGDTVFNFAGPETAIFIQNKKELRESLGRLKTLDAKTVYPGHGRPFPMDQLKKLSL